MRERTILVPLDGSELAERAIGPAGQLARAVGAGLVLLRVVAERPPEHQAVRAAALEGAERYLCAAADRARAAGTRHVVVEAVAGDPAEAILAQATLWRAEMVVLATHGRGGLGRLLHGSVADAVVRGARVPVLLIPARGAGQPTLAGNAIVVAVDGSPFAEAALVRAAEIARELAMPLVIVQSVGVEPPAVAGIAPVLPDLEDVVAAVQGYLDALVDRVRRAGVDATARVTIGPPARAILDVAEAADAALVVMATHGRTALTRLTMGSVATEVLTHSRRPLMLLRPEPADTGLETRAAAGDPVELTAGGPA